MTDRPTDPSNLAKGWDAALDELVSGFGWDQQGDGVVSPSGSLSIPNTVRNAREACESASQLLRRQRTCVATALTGVLRDEDSHGLSWIAAAREGDASMAVLLSHLHFRPPVGALVGEDIASYLHLVGVLRTAIDARASQVVETVCRLLARTPRLAISAGVRLEQHQSDTGIVLLRALAAWAEVLPEAAVHYNRLVGGVTPQLDQLMAAGERVAKHGLTTASCEREVYAGGWLLDGPVPGGHPGLALELKSPAMVREVVMATLARSANDSGPGVLDKLDPVGRWEAQATWPHLFDVGSLELAQSPRPPSFAMWQFEAAADASVRRWWWA